MYLLDTVIVSELRKRHRDAGVVEWLASVTTSDLFLSAITVGEIELGIEKQRAVDPNFAESLAGWLEITLNAYRDRVLPVDVNVARRWGRLAARSGNKGLDLAIAATALEHGLTVVTRNISDFVVAGVATLNPFTARAPRRG
jgi:predicted nucleic acid-binding protein